MRPYCIRRFSSPDLAAEYGVCIQNIDLIVTRKRWKHVA
jgi:hypothetical protein